MWLSSRITETIASRVFQRSTTFQRLRFVFVQDEQHKHTFTNHFFNMCHVACVPMHNKKQIPLFLDIISAAQRLWVRSQGQVHLFLKFRGVYALRPTSQCHRVGRSSPCTAAQRLWVRFLGGVHLFLRFGGVYALRPISQCHRVGRSSPCAEVVYEQQTLKSLVTSRAAKTSETSFL